jgi:hypothetical protein
LTYCASFAGLVVRFRSSSPIAPSGLELGALGVGAESGAAAATVTSTSNSKNTHEADLMAASQPTPHTTSLPPFVLPGSISTSETKWTAESFGGWHEKADLKVGCYTVGRYIVGGYIM